MKWLTVALACVAAPAAGAQTVKAVPRSDVTLGLERGACERRCAVYQVTLHGDGRVFYEGRHYVRRAGAVRTRFNPAELRGLLAQFEALKFFELKDVYGGEPGDCVERREDQPRSTLTLNLGGRSKTVRHSVGCIGPVASRLTELGNAIDRVANTKRWIR